MVRQSPSPVEEKTGRKFYLDHPETIGPDDQLTFILNLHGGGSSGQWQRMYFPACDYADVYKLIVASPTAASDPPKRWVGEDDDEHLHNVVELIRERFGADRIRGFWLAGHSQGGMTSRRLLGDEWWASRVDGWISLSGGRLGAAERAESAGPPRREDAPAMDPEVMRRMRAGANAVPDADFSFIYATGEHEIASLPETSPWAEKYGAGPRKRLPDVIDTEPGQVHDGRYSDDQMTKAWGRHPKGGTSQMWVYPGARDGRVIADVVRLDKGHTEGLEPKITEELVKLIVSAPGGKLG